MPRTFTYTTGTPSSNQFSVRYNVTNYSYAINEYENQVSYFLGIVIQKYTGETTIENERYQLWIYNGLTTPLYPYESNIFTNFFNPNVNGTEVSPPPSNEINVYQLIVENGLITNIVFQWGNQYSSTFPVYGYNVVEAGAIAYSQNDWMNYYNQRLPLYVNKLIPPPFTPTRTPPFTPSRTPYTPTPAPPAESTWQKYKPYWILLIIFVIIILIVLIVYFVKKGKSTTPKPASPPPPATYSQFF